MRAAPRYSVSISPLSLDTKACSVLDVRSRYSNMYVPSDFCHLSMDWVGAFPLYRPFSLGNATKFHICHKDVTPLEPFPANIDPPDADYSYCAKIMLLAQPSLEDIYKQCCSLAEDSKENFTHPTRVLQFLVGMKAKNEPLAIGGPWSPSLDGPNPADNPQVLIKTAIRTTKDLTGIDLSACTQWYRFVDISYLRPEEVHKGKTIPEHKEHVVMFLPDIWSVVPAMMDYLSLQASYKRSLLIKLGHEEEPAKVEETAADPPVADTAPAPEATPAPETTPDAETAAQTSQSQTTEEEEASSTVTSAVEETEAIEKPEPTHWSKLDPKSMKVVELRTELEARGESCKGLKTQLQAKLSKLLKVEMEEAENEETPAPVPEEEAEAKEEADKPASPAKEPTPEPVELTKEEKEKKAKELEKLKAHLEKQYVFPEEPVVLVHPNRSAKNGKFDCSVMSLSVLLDYRPEDNKEHSFEVSLFAESFNEMLMRDFGFSIYKKVCAIPAKEEKKSVEEASSEKTESKSTDGDTAANDKDADKSSDSKDDKADSGSKRKREASAETDSKKRKKDEENEDDKSSVSGSVADRSERGSSTAKRDKKEVEKRKLVTADRASLLAFVYYDTTHIGYLVDKDIEDMIYTLGMQLSRSQIRALLQKNNISKDSFNYRRLTDIPEPRADDPVVPAEMELDLQQLAQGNRVSTEQSGTKVSSEANEMGDGVVMYNGAVLELDKVMSKLDKSETSRLQVEKEMRSVQEERETLKVKLAKSEERLKKLTSDLKKTSDKLSSTKSERNRREDEVSHLKDILHTSSRELHKVVQLVDSSIISEVKESKQSGSDRYTPSKELPPALDTSTTNSADISLQDNSNGDIGNSDSLSKVANEEPSKAAEEPTGEEMETGENA